MIPPLEIPKPGRRVLLLEGVHDRAADRLREAGYQLHVESSNLSEEEPSVDGWSFNSPLRGLPNVILTPHIGGSTEEA